MLQSSNRFVCFFITQYLLLLIFLLKIRARCVRFISREQDKLIFSCKYLYLHSVHCGVDIYGSNGEYGEFMFIWFCCGLNRFFYA